ncbi:nucleoredoxin-like [Seminavis robusta]|uniref:Nucleoredoxin-like n=1 Tax=Seminavis robusta TaxID=568900 RepID=A0A9N8HQH3_9STRA|nr:nucleoredoxin-like [Seminavis robusta]|eukprot:Sro985_g228000.1 nucleoredoxin-like (434) ;mRNA; f:13453-15002
MEVEMEVEMGATNARVIEQFGADTQLWCASTNQYASASEVLSNKVVVILFSAYWCGPCRRFSPLLKTLYENLRKQPRKEEFEFVYCSMDNYTTEYKHYASTMPWWSLPPQSPVTDRLRTIYKSEGIPHLCVIDAEGNLLCGDAVNEAMEDTAGARFPWRCPKAVEEILPDTYVKNDQTYHPTAELDNKYLMLYFGAGWCPRSTAFTRKVVRAYRALKRTRDDFEMLYVSSDRDRRAFKETHSQMPFGAIPFGDRYAKNKLAHFLGIRGIPALLIFGPRPPGGGNRPLINANIREVFERGDHMREFPYHPNSYGDINRVTADIQQHRFVIVFHEAGDDYDQDEIREALQEASKIYNESGTGKPIKFCWAFSFSGLCESLRSVLRLGMPKDAPAMILLDIPDSGAFYVCPESHSTDITADCILNFMKSPGPRIQI